MPRRGMRFSRTAEEFDRVDRASRAVNSASITKFCRRELMELADEILAKKKQ